MRMPPPWWGRQPVEPSGLRGRRELVHKNPRGAERRRRAEARPARGRMRRLPPIVTPRNRGRMVRQVGYGLGHAALGIASAWYLHFAFRSEADRWSIRWIVGCLLVLAVASFGLRVMEARDAEWLGQDFVMRVRRRVLRAVIERPWEPAAISRWGVTLNRLSTDLGSLRNWVSSGIARMLSASVTLAGLWVGLALLDLSMAVWTSGVIGLAFVIGWVMTRPLRERIRKGRRRRGQLAGRAGSLVQSGSVVRQLGKVSEEVGRVEKLGKRLRRDQVDRVGWTTALRRIPEMVQVGAVVGFLCVAVEWRGGSREPGGVGMVAPSMLLVALMTTALGDIGRAWVYRVAYLEGSRRVRSVLAERGMEPGREARPLPGEGPVSLRFDAVRWEGAVTGFSASARPGERVAVMGPSGSGKSMLLRFAGRLLEPVSGTVSLDEVPAGEISDLYRVVQLVSPDVPLRAGTVRQTLGLDPGPGAARTLEWVATLLGLAEEPRLIPGGWDGVVTEGGANLSAGARARLCLARALIQRPRLLLIDDATFCLDTSARAALRRALELTSATVLMATPPDLSVFPQELSTVWHLPSEPEEFVAEA